MRPRKVVHRPIEALAVQVTAPLRDVSSFVPRSRRVDYPSGKLKHFHLVDAVGRTAASEGDWVLKFANGAVQILTDEEFQSAYQ